MDTHTHGSYITLRYVTLRYVKLRYVTLRYVTLHYVCSPCCGDIVCMAYTCTCRLFSGKLLWTELELVYAYVLQELGISLTEEEILILINELDKDGDGEINYR